MQDIFKKRCFSTQIRQDGKNICYNVMVNELKDMIMVNYPNMKRHGNLEP